MDFLFRFFLFESILPSYWCIFFISSAKIFSRNCSCCVRGILLARFYVTLWTSCQSNNQIGQDQVTAKPWWLKLMSSQTGNDYWHGCTLIGWQKRTCDVAYIDRLAKKELVMWRTLIGWPSIIGRKWWSTCWKLQRDFFVSRGYSHTDCFLWLRLRSYKCSSALVNRHWKPRKSNSPTFKIHYITNTGQIQYVNRLSYTSIPCQAIALTR